VIYVFEYLGFLRLILMEVCYSVIADLLDTGYPPFGSMNSVETSKRWVKLSKIMHVGYMEWLYPCGYKTGDR